jgi:DNA repair exonuclease SbcCD nuclease subunit
MKIIAIGDPHFRTDNIPEVDMFMDRVESLCREEEPTFIVILGDLLHTHERLHTIPLNKTYELVSRLRDIAPTMVLVGNHDMISNQQFLTRNHWMGAMKEWRRVEIVDTILRKEVDGYRFVFCPYVSPGRFEEALNSDDGDFWKGANCIFAHQEFAGCKMGAIVSVEGDKWSTDYPDVVSGHIHSRQKIQDNIYYTGSAMQHAFGDSDKNIIAILSWESPEERYILREVDLELPRKKIIYTDIQAIEEYTPKETEDKVKITITGVYEEFKAFKKTKKYRDIVKSGTKVVFKPKKLEKKDDGDTEKKDEFEVIDETDFTRILTSLVMKEKNPFLYQIHELVVNDREIPEDDIILF